ncbi:hypothetical protein GOP47_0000084 [Adiantum capillus-veneris]|uniref:Pentatricopeptide repeat-containing protein n=1 Tax=Adiantum capillus-veneris TaxID=13818 RepID=A0A9D4VD96_ADICA|nr:hypothetical protein GOP47_0000084 [Adiantum capillus-veneris]
MDISPHSHQLIVNSLRLMAIATLRGCLEYSLHALVNIYERKLSGQFSNYAFTRSLSQCYSVKVDHSSELIKSLQTLCEDGRLHEALELIDSEVPDVTPDAYRCLLQTCINRKDLAIGHKSFQLVQNMGKESKLLNFT